MTTRTQLAGVGLALLLAAALSAQSPESPKPPKPARVGQAAPDFVLEDLSGRRYALGAYRSDPARRRPGSVVVLVWWSASGPAVAKVDPIVRALHAKFKASGVRFLAVAPFASRESNRPGKESPVLIREFKRLRGIDFPVLLDFDRQATRRFGVTRVPEVVVLDRSGILRYRGAIVTPFSKPGERQYRPYLENALAAVLAGRMVLEKQTDTWGNVIPD